MDEDDRIWIHGIITELSEMIAQLRQRIVELEKVPNRPTRYNHWLDMPR